MLFRSEDFLDLAYDPGNTYTVPYQWGTTGIGYNVNAVGFEVTSWQDMFEYDGPVSWLSDVPGMFGIALLMQGYDPNTRDVDEIEEAKEFLIENGRNVVYINQDDGQEVLLRGEAHMVIEYSGDIFQIIEECECDDFAYVIPEEGTNFWVDSVAIPVGARNPELAHVFIDYLLDPQVSADIANYTAYGTPNQAAIEAGLIDEELLNDPGIYPSAEEIHNAAWDEIRIFVGR